MALLNLNWQNPHCAPFLQKEISGTSCRKKYKSILYEEGYHEPGVQTSKLQQSTKAYSQHYRVVQYLSFLIYSGTALPPKMFGSDKKR